MRTAFVAQWLMHTVPCVCLHTHVQTVAVSVNPSLTILSRFTPFLAATSFRSLGSAAAIRKTETGLPSSFDEPLKCVQGPQATSKGSGSTL